MQWVFSHYQLTLLMHWVPPASLSGQDLDLVGESMHKFILFQAYPLLSVRLLLILLPSKYDLWMENMEGTHGKYLWTSTVGHSENFQISFVLNPWQVENPMQTLLCIAISLHQVVWIGVYFQCSHLLKTLAESGADILTSFHHDWNILPLHPPV